MSALSLSSLRILSLNVNGIRQKRKKQAPGGFISGLNPQPDVCIFTETHMYDGEAAAMTFDSYEYANHSCREPDVEQACGRVLILVKIGTPFTKLDEFPKVSLPLNGCSILVYLRCEDFPIGAHYRGILLSGCETDGSAGEGADRLGVQVVGPGKTGGSPDGGRF